LDASRRREAQAGIKGIVSSINLSRRGPLRLADASAYGRQHPRQSATRQV